MAADGVPTLWPAIFHILFGTCQHFLSIFAALKYFQNKYPGVLNKSRGLGTLCAIDFSEAATRDKVMADLRKNGNTLVHLLLPIHIEANQVNQIWLQLTPIFMK